MQEDKSGSDFGDCEGWRCGGAWKPNMREGVRWTDKVKNNVWREWFTGSSGNGLDFLSECEIKSSPI